MPQARRTPAAPQSTNAAPARDDAPAPDAPESPAATPDRAATAAQIIEDGRSGRGPRSTSGQYVLLTATVDEPLEWHLILEDDDKPTDDDGLPRPRLYTGGQEDSKRSAIKNDPDGLGAQVREGTVLLVAIPAASWKPTRPRLKQREPVLDLG